MRKDGCRRAQDEEGIGLAIATRVVNHRVSSSSYWPRGGLTWQLGLVRVIRDTLRGQLPLNHFNRNVNSCLRLLSKWPVIGKKQKTASSCLLTFFSDFFCNVFASIFCFVFFYLRWFSHEFVTEIFCDLNHAVR